MPNGEESHYLYEKAKQRKELKEGVDKNSWFKAYENEPIENGGEFQGIEGYEANMNNVFTSAVPGQ
jgi:hypothetical protein